MHTVIYIHNSVSHGVEQATQTSIILRASFEIPRSLPNHTRIVTVIAAKLTQFVVANTEEICHHQPTPPHLLKIKYNLRHTWFNSHLIIVFYSLLVCACFHAFIHHTHQQPTTHQQPPTGPTLIHHPLQMPFTSDLIESIFESLTPHIAL